ncbi:LOW QUALITY PROTEIN: proline-rich protein 5-like [Synchiropus picturatus]
MERESSLRRSLQSRLRLGGASGSSSLSDLSQAEEPRRASRQRSAGANATWNSIHNAVIGVFQRKPLPDHELFALNEGVRQLLKTELGSFFTEYLQNQLLTKGMVILRDKIRLYEGQKLLDSCAETWTFFFGDVLSALQAVFYPVQGKEPSVRQLALLHFRNVITLNLKLDEALSRPRARVPPAVVQMLLVLQGVHESAGVTDDYLRLERLVQSVVSPYLSSQGLSSADGARPGGSGGAAPPAVKNPVVRSKSYNVPLLSPVVESGPDSSSGGAVRRHSVSEMTSCAEEAGPGPTVTEPCGPDQPGVFCCSAPVPRPLTLTRPRLSSAGREPGPAHAPSSPWASEPEARVRSSDSEPDGIFLDFGSVTQS